MSLNKVTLVCDLYDGAESPVVQGVGTLVPTTVLTDSSDQVIAGLTPVPVPFHAGGLPQVSLLATDNAGLLPAGWAWTFTPPAATGIAAFNIPLAAGPFSFTATNASPCVFSAPGYAAGYVNGTAVTLAGGSLPAGFSAATTYYVVAASGTTFRLAATPGGAALGSTSAGSGTVQTTAVHLSALSPVSSAASMQAYLPLPSGTPSAGQVPVATGVGEASAWGSGGGSGTVQSVTAGDASILVGGTTANPTVETGTLDQVAALHPPAAAVPMNSKKITGLANGATATDAAAFGQIPATLPPSGPAGGALSGSYPNPGIVLDSTAADIQPSPGTQAAGSAGKPADAGHVHGQPPVLAPTGLTGATAASRYAGATTSGAPASGTFAVGDFVVDQSGKVWICTTAGTPGTWTAAGPTIPVTIAQGGTGQTTQQAAIDALTGTQSAGKVLRSDGTHATLAPIQASDVPTLNQNTTGTAANITATLDQVPAPAANVSLNSKKIANLANGSAASDAAAFGQIPVADTTAADIQPVGTAAAAGSNGKWTDSGHVHAGVQLAGDLGNTISSPQVVSTHLTAPLPVIQGGTGTATGAPQNDVFAGPASGGAGAPGFRALAAGDIPDLPYVDSVTAADSSITITGAADAPVVASVAAQLAQRILCT